MPAKDVKAYVKRNKNDAADAEAICEAVRLPGSRAKGFCACQGLRRRGSACVSSVIDTGRIAFCGTENISTPNLSYAAQYLAWALPCERFTSDLADNPRITRGRYGSLSPFARDGLHRLPFAGLPAHPSIHGTFLPETKLNSKADMRRPLNFWAAYHRDLLGLSWRLHPQIGATLGPGSGQIRMRQRLALVGEEKHDIAGLRLRLSQCQPEAHAVDGVGVLAALQGVSRPAPAEFFLRSTLDRRDLEMVTPSRASISPMRRASVQLCRSATGASSNGVATLSAASALTGAGPGAGLVLSASTRRAQSRCATGAPYPREPRTLRQCAGWSNPTTSAIRLSPDPPRRDRAKPQGSAMPPSALHSPPPEICPPCPTPANQCEDGITPASVG